MDAGDGRPLCVTVRVMYFSKDGAQADNGDTLQIDVTTSSTVETLLHKAREAAQVGDKGKLLLNMRPLKDLALSMDAAGITKYPNALHLMLSRKFRPPEVVERAAVVAEEINQAMQAAQAEAAAAGRAVPKKRRLAMEAAAKAAEEAKAEGQVLSEAVDLPPPPISALPSSRGGDPVRPPSAKGELVRRPSSRGGEPMRRPSSRGEDSARRPSSRGEDSGRRASSRGEDPARCPSSRGEVSSRGPSSTYTAVEF